MTAKSPLLARADRMLEITLLAGTGAEAVATRERVRGFVSCPPLLAIYNQVTKYINDADVQICII